METISQILARELNREQAHIDNVIKLLDEGNTIPFIARYRKELHGAMDDTALRTLSERLEYLRNLQERRDTVKKSVEEQGKLTEELSNAIDEAATLAAGHAAHESGLAGAEVTVHGDDRAAGKIFRKTAAELLGLPFAVCNVFGHLNLRISVLTV